MGCLDQDKCVFICCPTTHYLPWPVADVVFIYQNVYHLCFRYNK